MLFDARTLNFPRSPIGVDDLAGLDGDLLAAERVAHPYAGHPLALAQEADHARGGD